MSMMNLTICDNSSIMFLFYIFRNNAGQYQKKKKQKQKQKRLFFEHLSTQEVKFGI